MSNPTHPSSSHLPLLPSPIPSPEPTESRLSELGERVKNGPIRRFSNVEEMKNRLEGIQNELKSIDSHLSLLTESRMNLMGSLRGSVRGSLRSSVGSSIGGTSESQLAELVGDVPGGGSRNVSRRGSLAVVAGQQGGRRLSLSPADVGGLVVPLIGNIRPQEPVDSGEAVENVIVVLPSEDQGVEANKRVEEINTEGAFLDDNQDNDYEDSEDDSDSEEFEIYRGPEDPSPPSPTCDENQWFVEWRIPAKLDPNFSGTQIQFFEIPKLHVDKPKQTVDVENSQTPSIMMEPTFLAENEEKIKIFSASAASMNTLLGPQPTSSAALVRRHSWQGSASVVRPEINVVDVDNAKLGDEDVEKNAAVCIPVTQKVEGGNIKPPVALGKQFSAPSERIFSKEEMFSSDQGRSSSAIYLIHQDDITRAPSPAPPNILPESKLKKTGTEKKVVFGVPVVVSSVTQPGIRILIDEDDDDAEEDARKDEDAVTECEDGRKVSFESVDGLEGESVGGKCDDDDEKILDEDKAEHAEPQSSTDTLTEEQNESLKDKTPTKKQKPADLPSLPPKKNVDATKLFLTILEHVESSKAERNEHLNRRPGGKLNGISVVNVNHQYQHASTLFAHTGPPDITVRVKDPLQGLVWTQRILGASANIDQNEEMAEEWHSPSAALFKPRPKSPPTAQILPPPPPVINEPSEAEEKERIEDVDRVEDDTFAPEIFVSKDALMSDQVPASPGAPASPRNRRKPSYVDFGTLSQLALNTTMIRSESLLLPAPNESGAAEVKQNEAEHMVAVEVDVAESTQNELEPIESNESVASPLSNNTTTHEDSTSRQSRVGRPSTAAPRLTGTNRPMSSSVRMRPASSRPVMRLPASQLGDKAPTFRPASSRPVMELLARSAQTGGLPEISLYERNISSAGSRWGAGSQPSKIRLETQASFGSFSLWASSSVGGASTCVSRPTSSRPTHSARSARERQDEDPGKILVRNDSMDSFATVTQSTVLPREDSLIDGLHDLRSRPVTAQRRLQSRATTANTTRASYKSSKQKQQLATFSHTTPDIHRPKEFADEISKGWHSLYDNPPILSKNGLYYDPSFISKKEQQIPIIVAPTSYKVLHQKQSSFYLTDDGSDAPHQGRRSRASSCQPDDPKLRRSGSDLGNLLNVNFEGVSLLQQLVAQAQETMYVEPVIPEEVPVELVTLADHEPSEHAPQESEPIEKAKKTKVLRKRKLKKKKKSKKEKAVQIIHDIPPPIIEEIPVIEPEEETEETSSESDWDVASGTGSLNLEEDTTEKRINDLENRLKNPPPHFDVERNAILPIDGVPLSETVVTVDKVTSIPYWVQIGMSAMVIQEKSVCKVQRQVKLHLDRSRYMFIQDFIRYIQRMFRARRVRQQYQKVKSIKKSGRNVGFALKKLDKLDEDAEITGRGEHRRPAAQSGAQIEDMDAYNSTESSVESFLNDSITDLEAFRATLNPVRTRIRDFIRKRRIANARNEGPHEISEVRKQVWNKYLSMQSKVAQRYPEQMQLLQSQSIIALKKQLAEKLSELLEDKVEDDHLEEGMTKVKEPTPRSRRSSVAGPRRMSMVKAEVDRESSVLPPPIEGKRSSVRASTSSARFLSTADTQAAVAPLEADAEPAIPKLSKNQAKRRERFIEINTKRIKMLKKHKTEKEEHIRKSILEIRKNPNIESIQLLLTRVTVEKNVQ
ncbi:hypothetical protein HDV05_006652 [Chytridiales sp. JEL 0842]|nr:hypothetical protein HDV05_006652 [Chytridiales sp. JEL 0842]